jgi:hypothetical protein
MIWLRFLVIAFNVVVVVYLIFRMLEVIKLSISPFKKRMIIIGGLILLLAPLGIFLRFFQPTIQYFLIYPAAIALYIYMIREIK